MNRTVSRLKQPGTIIGGKWAPTRPLMHHPTADIGKEFAVMGFAMALATVTQVAVVLHIEFLTGAQPQSLALQPTHIFEPSPFL